jgi:TRAP-type mannitol/chloroaromatic compound transport system permease small subunit
VERLATKIDRVNRWIGRALAWLVLAMVLMQFALVIARYVFGVGSIAAQESLLYMNGVLFLLAAGYTLLLDGHVRVDILYREAPPRVRAAIDLAGVFLLLLPFCFSVWIHAFPYVAASWEIREGSREASGLQAIFLFKSAMLLFVILLALQGVSLALRAGLVLTRRSGSTKSSLADEGR